MVSLFVIGDIHGQHAKLIELLRAVHLIDAAHAWSGHNATLWFIGDFFDRGPDGIGVVDLIRRLQQEAPASGGSVNALIGNHEPLILSAKRFGDRPTGWGGTFLSDWQRNGGEQRDLDGLTPDRIAWLSALPAMALVADRLLMHADATLYTCYGNTIDHVNAAFAAILNGDDQQAYNLLLERFSQRAAFAGRGIGKRDRAATFLARQFLDQYGGQQIIHGHTPITKMTKQAPETITEPLVYAGGFMCQCGQRCVPQRP